MLVGMKHYQVKLSDEERKERQQMGSSGSGAARAIRRAQILLKSEEGWTERAIATAFGVSRQTVHVVRKRCVEAGAQQTLPRKPGHKAEKVLDGVAEAHLIALTCSEPPKGRERWTLRVLANRLVSLGHVPAVSHETVRQTLKKTR
jgi:transposase